MTNVVSAFETWPDATRRQGERALVHLLEVAGSDVARSRELVIFFQVAAEEVERRSVGGVLPDDERQLWESVGADFSDPEALIRSRARSAAAFADLVARSIHGDAALAQFLKVNRSRVSQRVAERSLYSFLGPRRERYFPVWQFVDHKPLRGLQVVLAALSPQVHPLVLDHWARAPSTDLVVDGELLSPVQWLLTGGSSEHLIELLPQP